MRAASSLTIATAALLSATQVAAANNGTAVFAHYMIGTVFEDHAHQDIDDAAAMGLDGFVLNVGDPEGASARTSFNNMFDYARDNHPNFKLFISMDLWSQKNLSNFDHLFTDFLSHEAYYKGPNGFPFVSTYGDGGFQQDKWNQWRDRWADSLFFVPDFAGILDNGNVSDRGWWEEWGGVADGLFSWETTWPVRGQANTLDFATDEDHRMSTRYEGKSYMLGLSLLQYKNSYGANIYRSGEETMTNRMDNILGMSDKPDFVQILTWNDGPESHYIGNIWPEQNNDTVPNVYATQKKSSHTAIQPLLTSFINAFKKGVSSSAEMAPLADNSSAAGAIWFKPTLLSTSCKEDGDLHHGKPDGYSVAADVSAWAVVVRDADVDARGFAVHGFSGGDEVGQQDLKGGLNHGNFTLKAGKQCLEVRDRDGGLVAVARGAKIDVTDNCPDGIYNLNPQVLVLSEEEAKGGGCADNDSDAVANNDDDDDSFGVRVGLDKVCLGAALLVSLVSATGLF